jgi:catechol 2,3-dioxygenase-like lactoylglutathione lyase family enzyme
VTLRAVNHIALRVNRMDTAERFYVGFFGMEVESRLRQSARGRLEPMIGEVDWPTAEQTGNEPQITFLANGPLRLALHNAGRGARLEMASQLDHISLTVDATTFARLKAEVLLRGHLLLASTETSFAFRDPFSITWEISVQGTPHAGW